MDQKTGASETSVIRFVLDAEEWEFSPNDLHHSREPRMSDILWTIPSACESWGGGGREGETEEGRGEGLQEGRGEGGMGRGYDVGRR